MAIKSLNQRLAAFLLLPVAVLLFLLGFGRVLLCNNVLLNEWKRAPYLKLQRLHTILIMRLSRPQTDQYFIIQVDLYQGVFLPFRNGILDQLFELWWRFKGWPWVDGYRAWSNANGEPVGSEDGSRAEWRVLTRGNISEVISPAMILSRRGDGYSRLYSRMSSVQRWAGWSIGTLWTSVAGYQENWAVAKRYGMLVDTSGNYLAHTAVLHEGPSSPGEMKSLWVSFSRYEEAHDEPFSPGRPPRIGWVLQAKGSMGPSLVAPEKKCWPMKNSPLFRGSAYFNPFHTASFAHKCRWSGRSRNLQSVQSARETIVIPLASETDTEIGQLMISFNKMVIRP